MIRARLGSRVYEAIFTHIILNVLMHVFRLLKNCVEIYINSGALTQVSTRAFIKSLREHIRKRKINKKRIE